MSIAAKAASKGVMFFIHRIMFVMNIGVVLLLLGTYLAPYINPKYIWWFAALGISYPIILGINIIFVVYWLTFFRPIKMLYSLLAIASGFSFTSRIFQWEGVTADRKDNQIKVLSYNANYFGVYSNSINSKSFFDYLKETSPDICCVQEFMWERNKRKNYLNKFDKALPGGHHTFLNVYTAMDTIHREYGMYIYSRFPITDSGKIEFENTKGNCVQWADIQTGKETVRIYNVHLQSIKFEERDYDIMKLNGNNDTLINKAGNILKKMKQAWQLRAQQTDLVKEHMKSCPHKIIMCGDFNDSPISYAYQSIRGPLKDAFIESGSGFSQTYSGRMPSFRIDYILADPSYEIYNYEMGDKYWSDHRLIQATLYK